MNADQSAARRPAPRPPVLEPDGLDQRVVAYVLRAGAQAPSFYNTQPWRFERSGDSIDVHLDDKADTSLYDWHNLNSTLACGAALENMVIAAQGRGLSATVTARPDPARPLLLARLTLTRDDAGTQAEGDWGHPLEEAIWRRHTNTLMFDESPPEPASLQALRDAVGPFPGVSLHFASTPEGRKKVFEAASTAEQVRFGRQDLHEQLHRMIRWNDAEVEAAPTGYTLPSMGACGVGEAFFRVTRRWPVMRLMNLLGANRDQAKRASLGLLHCSACGLLTVQGETGDDWLAAGRAMERLWLSATALGLDLQPHCTIAVFDWILKDRGETVFDAGERAVIQRGLELYREAFPALGGDSGGETGVFLFRIGQGPAVRGYTPRRDPGAGNGSSGDPAA